MFIPRSLVAIPITAALILGAWRSNGAPRAHAAPGSSSPNACLFLAPSEVGAALEVSVQPGKPPIPGSTSACLWSSEADDPVGGRRVALSLIQVAGFDFTKSRGSAKITITPVGVGDDAFYEIIRNESPFLFVKKGGTAFTLRILNGLKYKAFGLDEVKAKELVLARDVVGRL